MLPEILEAALCITIAMQCHLAPPQFRPGGNMELGTHVECSFNIR